MSSIIVLQDTSASVTVYLEFSAGGPATGLIFSDVLVDLQKEGGGSFTSKSMDGTNFIEIGAGAYQIILDATDTDTLGNMYIRITGATIDTALINVYVAASVPVNPTSPLSIGTTALFGYIVDLEGAPVSGASVSARVLATPAVGTSGNEGYVQSSSLVASKSDADGFFTLSLVTGSDVDIYISAANYRRTLRVPSTSQNLFDIL